MTDVGLSYRPGASPVHRLDARTKLLVQFALALLAFTWASRMALPTVWLVVAAGVLLAGLRPRAVVRGYSLPFALLGIGVLVRVLTIGPPWVDTTAGIEAVRHSLRVAAVLVASAVYVRTTPVVETQAAIGWLVPGRAGRLLAVGVGFVLRFLPVLLDDLQRARAAQDARLGHERPLHERMQTISITGLNRAFERADRFSLALRARCFAWNPTPPPMTFGRADWAVTLAVVLAIAVVVADTLA